MKKYLNIVLSISLIAAPFVLSSSIVIAQILPRTETSEAKAPDKKAEPLKHFKKGEEIVQLEDLLTTKDTFQLIPSGKSAPDRMLMKVGAKHYLFMKTSAFLPTVEDQLIEVSEKYMTPAALKAYGDAFHALEKKRNEIAERLNQFESKPEIKKLSGDAFDAKMKPEEDKAEKEFTAATAKLIQYSVENGNLVFGEKKQILITHFSDLLNDKTAVFTSVAVPREEIEREKMMEHFANTVEGAGANRIEKITITYKPDDKSPASMNIYDMKAMKVTKDGKPVDLSDKAATSPKPLGQ